MNIVLYSLLVALLGVCGVLYRANNRNYRMAEARGRYIQALEQGVTELHDKVSACDYIIRWQDDRINNLSQANGQLQYLLNPEGVKPISKGYDA